MATQAKDITFIIPGQTQTGTPDAKATTLFGATRGSVKVSVRVGTQRKIDGTRE